MYRKTSNSSRVSGTTQGSESLVLMQDRSPLQTRCPPGANWPVMMLLLT